MHADEEERQERAQNQVDRVLAEIEEAGPGEETAAPDIAPDRARALRGTNLSRMRISWSPQDRLVMAAVRDTAERYLREVFAPAFEVMDSVWSRVREPVWDDEHDCPMRDAYGGIQWKRGVTGRPLEDWTRLGDKERERALYQTLSVLFELEQIAGDLWGEAMFAKAAWEHKFADAFQAPEGKLTEADRTAAGRRGSVEERYFAIYRSWLSRRADAIIGTIRLLNQRMKDTID